MTSCWGWRQLHHRIIKETGGKAAGGPDSADNKVRNHTGAAHKPHCHEDTASKLTYSKEALEIRWVRVHSRSEHQHRWLEWVSKSSASISFTCFMSARLWTICKGIFVNIRLLSARAFTAELQPLIVHGPNKPLKRVSKKSVVIRWAVNKKLVSYIYFFGTNYASILRATWTVKCRIIKVEYDWDGRCFCSVLNILSVRMQLCVQILRGANWAAKNNTSKIRWRTRHTLNKQGFGDITRGNIASADCKGLSGAPPVGFCSTVSTQLQSGLTEVHKELPGRTGSNQSVDSRSFCQQFLRCTFTLFSDLAKQW